MKTFYPLDINGKMEDLPLELLEKILEPGLSTVRVGLACPTLYRNSEFWKHKVLREYPRAASLMNDHFRLFYRVLSGVLPVYQEGKILKTIRLGEYYQGKRSLTVTREGTSVAKRDSTKAHWIPFVEIFGTEIVSWQGSQAGIVNPDEVKFLLLTVDPWGNVSTIIRRELVSFKCGGAPEAHQREGRRYRKKWSSSMTDLGCSTFPLPVLALLVRWPGYQKGTLYSFIELLMEQLRDLANHPILGAELRNHIITSLSRTVRRHSGLQ